MAIAGTLTYKTDLDTSGVKKAGSTVKSIIAGLGIAKLITSAISTINNSIDDAITRFDTLNNFPKVMSNLGISAEESSKSIDKMSKKLAGLPTTLDKGALAVQRFASANSDVEKSTDIFLALNNAILAGGAGADIQASALEQLSQAYAKGKPDMMEWRTAMTAMPAQLKQVATAMGYVSADALGTALREGDESMDAFMETIVRLNTEGLEGFQNFEEQARNATGGVATAITVAKTQVVKGVTDILDALNKSFEDTKFGTFTNFIAEIGKKAKEVLDMIAKVITGEISFEDLFNYLLEQINTFLENLIKLAPTIIQIAVDIIVSLANALSENMDILIPLVVDLILVIVETLLDNLDLIVEAGVELIMALAEGLIEKGLPKLIDRLPTLVEKLLFALAESLPKLLSLGIRMPLELGKGIILGIPQLISKIPQLIRALGDSISKFYTNAVNIGKDIINGILEGFNKAKNKLINGIKSIVNLIPDIFKNVLKIGSPSKVMYDLSQWVPEGVALGIEANTDSVEKAMNDMYKEIDSTIKMENSKLNFNVVSGNVYNKSFYQTPVSIDLNAEVEMDSQKVGRLVTPTVTKTIKNGGGV